jgi:bifunctional DNA-binding transcriptional regulator/antitoxin component of YhaV-PrlF toxin-antitoxin module
MTDANTQKLGEISTLALNSPGHASLRTTVPMNIIRQWNLKSGDKLEWSWEARNNEMVVLVRKADESDYKHAITPTKEEWERAKRDSKKKKSLHS